MHIILFFFSFLAINAQILKKGWLNLYSSSSSQLQKLYFILNYRTIFALTSENDEVTKTISTFELNWLAGGATVNGHSGIIDIGNQKEGFCFKLISKVGNSWFLCSDSNSEKEAWMQIINNAMDVNNEYPNVYDSYQNENGKNAAAIKIIVQRNSNRFKHKNQFKKIILQDWSECNNFCGRGKKYLEEIRVYDQGKMKKNLVEKACKSDIDCNENLKFSQKNLVYPIIRESYFKCIIKEGHLFLNLRAERHHHRETAEILTVAVLNLNTFTLYWRNDLNSIYMSFDLRFLKVRNFSNLPCFLLVDTRDAKKNTKLCASSFTKKTKTHSKQEWIEAIYNFQEKCNKKNKLKKYSNH